MLDITITDALKNMVTDNPDNPISLPPKEIPVNIRIKNDLDKPHAFSIPGIFDSGKF